MGNAFEAELSGGHPNSLGNTVTVVETVLKDPSNFPELFNCYFSDDEVVRLRVSNAMKRIGKTNKGLLIPYISRFLDEVALIDQASTQWTLAQLFLMLEDELDEKQKAKALNILKKNLEGHQDWIVLNTTMETLGHWAGNDAALRSYLKPHLVKLAQEKRKSIARKAQKILESLS